MVYLDGIRPRQRTLLKPSWFRIKSWLLILVVIAIFGFGLKTVYSLPLVHSKVSLLKLLRSSGKYLVLFQNNRELRPSGGFIGSFAVVEQENGQIKTIYVDTNIYKRDKVFTASNTISPPPPLDTFVIDGKWSMRDSNWAVDYAEAAQKVAWFYQQEGGTDVDGVFAINASVFQDLLTIIGPIELPQYGLTISADNFYQEVQMQVEKAYYENPANKVTNEPKTILKDMLPEVLARIKKKEYRFKVASLFYRQLAEKQLLLYFKNTDLQKAVEDSGWAGRVEQTDGDYLYICEANLGANKSSLDIKEDVRVKAEIESDKIVNHLRLIRTHQGTADWPGGDNKNYSRILVPDGSKIVAAQRDGKDYLKEIQTQEEAGKTVFALWNNTSVGTSSVLELTYEVPKTVEHDKYSFYWQKQPGTLGDQLEVDVDGERKFEGWVDEDTIIK